MNNQIPHWNITYLSNNYAFICCHHAVLYHILQDHLIKRPQVEFWVNGGWCIGKVSLKWFALIALLWVLKCQAPSYHHGKYISNIYDPALLHLPSPGKKNQIWIHLNVWLKCDFGNLIRKRMWDQTYNNHTYLMCILFWVVTYLLQNSNDDSQPRL